MKIWSKGLGTMVLNMDFRKCDVELEGGDLLIKGQITDPVFWNYVITMKKDDIRGCANIVFKPGFLFFFLTNIRYSLVFLFEKVFRRSKYSPPDEKIEIAKNVKR
ncbi:MAG: hypothetical protein GY866_05700 [Proteobacteria bacterium]|nr:hypothetical protein [Pseudomonadota bacterium]